MDKKLLEFHECVKNNNVGRLRQFLEEGISPDDLSCSIINGRPAILEATSLGFVDVVKLLLDFHANANAQNSLGETALHHAFQPKTFSRDIIIDLLDNGADVNIRERLNGYTPMHIITKTLSLKTSTSCEKDILEVFKIMCATADSSIRSTRKESPMHRLVSGCRNWTEPLEILLEHGFEANAQNERGETSLMCAIDKGHSMMARLLVNRSACVNIKDRHFQTALHHSAQKNLLDMVTVLLDAQCDVNATDLNGDTALHIAASKGLQEMVKLLLKNPGIDANVQNIRGSTPLLNAVESGFTGVVKLLLDACSDADSEKSIMCAMDIAEDNYARRWHPEIFTLLQETLELKRDVWDEGETSL